MNKKLKAKIEKLAIEHGAELTWIKGKYGYYRPGTNKIAVGNKGSDATIISIFCHELGHYKNFLSGKYYKYHHYKGKGLLRRFKTKRGFVKYALKAELYTDKVGKRLCAELFPSVKYHGGYKDTKEMYEQMYMRYFGGYYIIILK